VEIGDIDRLADSLAGVRRTQRGGLAEWRYHGRVVARQLDDSHVVIRADFDDRDVMLRQFPGTFSVPDRFAKHMMIVADFRGGDAGAIEDAIGAAWDLQRGADLAVFGDGRRPPGAPDQAERMTRRIGVNVLAGQLYRA
jgi:hypothetical protein